MTKTWHRCTEKGTGWLKQLTFYGFLSPLKQQNGTNRGSSILSAIKRNRVSTSLAHLDGYFRCQLRGRIIVRYAEAGCFLKVPRRRGTSQETICASRYSSIRQRTFKLSVVVYYISLVYN